MGVGVGDVLAFVLVIGGIEGFVGGGAGFGGIFVALLGEGPHVGGDGGGGTFIAATPDGRG